MYYVASKKNYEYIIYTNENYISNFSMYLEKKFLLCMRKKKEKQEGLARLLSVVVF